MMPIATPWPNTPPTTRPLQNIARERTGWKTGSGLECFNASQKRFYIRPCNVEAFMLEANASGIQSFQ